MKVKFQFATVEANFAGPDNFISVGPFSEGSPPVEQIGVSTHGVFSLSDMEVADGLFGLRSATLTYGYTNNRVTEVKGAAEVKLPSGRTANGSIGFKVVDGSWQLDELSLGGDHFNVLIPDTPVYFQSIDGSVKDLAVGEPAPTFEGKIGFTIGPKIDVPIPAVFGGPFNDVSLVALDVTVTVTADLAALIKFNVDELVIAVAGALSIAGGVEKGTVSGEMNFPQRQYKFAATYTALGGFISGNANLAVNWNADITGSGSAKIQVPASIPLIGGLTMVGGSAYLQYRNNGTFADDFVSGYVEIPVGPFTKRFGLRVGFDGSVESLSAPLPSVAPAAGAAAGAVSAQDLAARKSFGVSSSGEPVVLGAGWENAAAPGVPFRVVAPDGTVYTNTDAGRGKIQVLPELSSDRRLSVAVLSPQPGVWTLELPQPDALGAVTIDGVATLDAPSVTVTSPSTTVSGEQVPVAYRVEAPNPDATVSLFYDTDAAGFDGKEIVGGLAAGSPPYLWDTTAVAPGDYYVYAVVSDAVGVPAFDYAPGVVHVAPRVVKRQLFYNNSAFDGHDPAANAADDGAIDTHKSGLLPGRRATFANVSGYTGGINGVMVDLAGLSPAAAGAITADDFDFRVGAGGRSGWTAAPPPSSIVVRPGAGLNGAARVSITWPDRSIRNTWLRVTVNADARTGLAHPDVFYFGSLVGKTGGPGSPLRLGAQDLLAVRRALSSVAAYASNAADLNHDGKVNAFDLAATRANLLRVLQPVDTTATLVGR
jgi:hypothetical protein